MYTLEMSTDFKAIMPPKNFGVTLLDNEQFITILIEPKDIEKLSKEEAVDAVKYINDVKNMLESHGAIVYVVREALKNE